MSKAISVEQLETSLSAVNNKMDTKLQEVVEVNLDLNNIPQEYTKFQDTPVGHILSFIGTTAPEHYLICNGSEYNISDYPELSKYLLKEFGAYNYFGGDGVTTFAVPNITGDSYNSGNDNILPCIKYESTLCINTGTIINTPNPLTTEPLEYGHFTLSADQSSLLVGSVVNLDTVSEGNLTLSENKVKLTGGKTYSINFYVRINSGAMLTCELYDYTNDVVITECVTAAAYPNAAPNRIITPLTDCLVGIRISYIDGADYITKRMSYLTVLEYRNNPVNQYGGFQTEVLFDGNINLPGVYTLQDYVDNYNYFIFSKKTKTSPNLVPELTGNSANENYIVSSSSLKSSGQAYWAFSSSTGDWYSGAGVNSWLQIKFKQEVRISGFWCKCASTSGSSNMFFPKDFIFEGSNDGTTYETITTGTFPLVGALQIHTVNLDNSAKYSIYRWKFTTAYSSDGSNNPLFSQIQLLGEPVNSIQNQIILESDVHEPFTIFNSTDSMTFEGNTLVVDKILNNYITSIVGYKGELPTLLSGGEF